MYVVVHAAIITINDLMLITEKKSESLFDQVKESMPEEEWLVLYMKGRDSRPSIKYVRT